MREICCATGFMGDPVGGFWRDAASFAEIFSAYYTDEEPGSLYVAESDGRVGGYLLGCLDSARAGSAQSGAARQVAARMLLLRPGTAGFFWRSAFDVVRDRGTPDGMHDARWPAHLHINLMPELRGHGGGAALMSCWLERLAREGVPGVHLSTWAENEAGIGFFERMGFERLGRPSRVPGFRTRAGARMHQQWMVREIAAVGAQR